MDELKKETRVRMGAKQTAKGQIQLDLTAEAPTVDEAAQMLGEALDKIVAAIKAKGFALVEA